MNNNDFGIDIQMNKNIKKRERLTGTLDNPNIYFDKLKLKKILLNYEITYRALAEEIGVTKEAVSFFVNRGKAGKKTFYKYISAISNDVEKIRNYIEVSKQ